jgi:hypothetical protein
VGWDSAVAGCYGTVFGVAGYSPGMWRSLIVVTVAEEGDWSAPNRAVSDGEDSHPLTGVIWSTSGLPPLWLRLVGAVEEEPVPPSENGTG